MMSKDESADEYGRLSVLRRADLKIGDPRVQENLVERVPEGMEPDTILNRYDFREGKVRCAVCSRRQRHNIGITLSLPDGTKALCGSDCAEDLYGPAVWQRLDLDFKAREREVILRDLIEPMGDLVKRIRSVANPWFGLSGSISDFLTNLQELAPSVFESLADAVRRRDSRLEGEGGQVVHVIAGGACLLEDPHDVLKVLGNQFRDVEDLLAGNTEKIEVLERLSRLRGNLRSGMIQAADLLTAGLQFVQLDNLRAIVRWVNRSARKGGRHKVRDETGAVIYEIETGKDDGWEVSVPMWQNDFDIPSRENIIRLFD